MSKRDRDSNDRPGPAMQRSTGLPPGLIGFATLLGVAALIFIGMENRRQTSDLQQALAERLTQIETRMTQLSAKLDAVASRVASANAPAPQRGPDPGKIYTVKTDGSPYKGPRSAPVTIAEFSDFQ